MSILRVIRVLPVVLCVGIAILQAILAHTHHILPWRGGGYGMFSTFSDLKRRTVLIDCVDEKDRVCMVILNRNRRWYAQFNLFPSNRKMENLAMELLNKPMTVYEPDREKITHRVRSKEYEGHFRVKLDQGSLIYRPVREQPNLDINKQVVHLKSIRVSGWEIRFDSRQHKLYWSQYTPTVEASKS